ncbi:hypothetical protein AAFF_G00167070 [Aldrovandia affinis]|uniref:Uncharacterized protein n=1 Tax=Aldrovandia affinis TaxID=143900 RepID=A0AAD7W7Z8_9TELE|nr:hypothetical protein AAFF_G00167070 [Aldrovandia affinis]
MPVGVLAPDNRRRQRRDHLAGRVAPQRKGRRGERNRPTSARQRAHAQRAPDGGSPAPPCRFSSGEGVLPYVQLRGPARNCEPERFSERQDGRALNEGVGESVRSGPIPWPVKGTSSLPPPASSERSRQQPQGPARPASGLCGWRRRGVPLIDDEGGPGQRIATTAAAERASPAKRGRGPD